MQLAPDNRIYINPTGGSKFLHVIEYPDLKGLRCIVQQHAVKLPTPTGSIPLLTNVRLGAIEGSPCDTIVEDVSNIHAIHGNNISISPNPATHQLNIEITDNFSKGLVFHFFDINGVKVKTVELSSSIQSVNLDGLAAGLFFYQTLENGRLLKTDKVVIMK